MIRFDNVSVRFAHRKHDVAAVNGVSLTVAPGEIFGIAGTSGAGKSTLLRTVNLLQRPTSGRIWVGGEDVTGFTGGRLRQLRSDVGMIFQQYNLIHTKTVAQNIALALRIAGKTEGEITRRTAEVLELVGLSDKSAAYPATLSGGQKQRVGIARAIANDPSILLCDEPTSALDPETTDSVLRLLREINRRLGITTVVITHEMNVIRKLCDRVAVMSCGEVLEHGDVFRVFASPQHPFTRSLVDHTFNVDLPARLRTDHDAGMLLRIVYSGSGAERPVISETIRRFGVDVNILHGAIEYISGQALGVLLVHLAGDPQQIAHARAYIENQTCKVEQIDGN